MKNLPLLTMLLLVSEQFFSRLFGLLEVARFVCFLHPEIKNLALDSRLLGSMKAEKQNIFVGFLKIFLLHFNFAVELKKYCWWHFNFADFRSQPQNRELFMPRKFLTLKQINV